MLNFILEVGGVDGFCARKTIQYSHLPRIGDCVWFENDSAEVTSVDHYLAHVTGTEPSVVVTAQIDTVRDEDTFRHFFTKTEGWEFFTL